MDSLGKESTTVRFKIRRTNRDVVHGLPNGQVNTESLNIRKKDGNSSALRDRQV